MKKLMIILVFSMLSIHINAQNINKQLLHLKLKMLPETSFRFPVGDSVGHGYYIAQPFQNKWEHLGIDVSGFPGGDSDLGDTIYSIGYGLVTYAEKDCHISVIHKYKGKLIKAIYFHCDTVFYQVNSLVSKGMPIATIGKKGTHQAHLHFEITKDTTVLLGAYGPSEGRFYDPMDLLPFYKTK